MANLSIDFNARELMHNVSLDVTIRVRDRWRFIIARWLFGLAAWISGVGYEVTMVYVGPREQD